jgi:hypothetical protein
MAGFGRSIGSLGSVPHDPSPTDRIAFWHRVRERLAQLSNRIDGEARIKLLDQIDACVALPTALELRELKRTNPEAEAEAKVWDSLHDVSAAPALSHRKLAEQAEAVAKDAKARADAARTAGPAGARRGS